MVLSISKVCTGTTLCGGIHVRMNGGIVAYLREWNKDIFELASLTARSSNS